MTAPEPNCGAEVCITCSDQAVAVPIVELLGAELAMVDTGAGLERVSVALVDAAVGHTVLVHAGEAIAIVAPGTVASEGAVAPGTVASGPAGPRPA